MFFTLDSALEGAAEMPAWKRDRRRVLEVAKAFRSCLVIYRTYKDGHNMPRETNFRSKIVIGRIYSLTL